MPFMRLGRRQRQLLRVSGVAAAGIVVLCVVLCVSLPLWFPGVLHPLARHAGARFARYQRDGYGRFSLFAFTYTNSSFRFRAGRIQALTPAAWISRLTTGPAPGSNPLLLVSDWHIDFLPATAPSPAPGSIYSSVRKLQADLGFLRRWAPQVALTNGVIQARTTSLDLPFLTLSNGILRASITVTNLSQDFEVKGNVTRSSLYELESDSASLQLQNRIWISTNTSGVGVRMAGMWRSNRFDLNAQFGHAGILPQSADFQARRFQVPGRLVRLPRYGDIRGSVGATWQRGQFEVDLSAGAKPRTAQERLPPLDLDVHARGNATEAVIDSARVSTPWLRASLSPKVSVYYTGKLLRAPATLKFTADLERQPWVRARGTLAAEAEFQPAAGRFPSARFHLSGTDVGIRDIQAASLDVNGDEDWPRLRISDARAAFSDGSRFSARAAGDLSTRVVDSGTLAFSGPLIRKWLPPGYSYEQLSLADQFQGPVKNLTHRGSLEVNQAVIPNLRPIRAGLNWEGTRNSIRSLAALISAGDSSLRLQGAMHFDAGGCDLQLNELTLSEAGRPLLALEKPASLSLLHAPDPRNPWQVRLQALRWAGSAGSVEAQASVLWPGKGAIEASIRNIRSTLATNFLKATLEPVDLLRMNCSASWSNSPVHFGIDLSAAGETPVPLTAELNLSGGTNGVSLQELQVISGVSTQLTARAFVPLTLTPGAKPGLLHLNPGGPLQAACTVQSQGLLWDRLSAWTHVHLTGPNLSIAVSGTVTEPRGTVRLDAKEIQFEKTKRPLPTLDDLQLEIQVDRQQARLNPCRVRVQGQPVTLTGEVPLGASFWAGLQAEKLPRWNKASAHLTVAGAKLSAFTGLYPALVSPEGQLDADLSLQPGFQLAGKLTVNGARTRPLPELGPLRDIGVRMIFQNRELILDNATADIGGSALRMSGRADLSGSGWLNGTLPPFTLAARGTNIPLVRRPDAIIRADLNLQAAKTNGETPVVGGTVRLRDSYLLSDLTALVPGKIAAPQRPPPYFSVTNPVLANWRLSIRTTGERFLTVRAPLFNGKVSANLQLKGTLQDPTALGEIKINSGVVQFPFGSLEVQQGFVTLTSANPYRPQLSVTAASKQFGYDITLQVTGPADAPIIQFSSSPPLSSEQILMLLTTGEFPQGTFSLTAQQRAQTLAVFLARDLMTKLGLGGLGEDRLTIHSGEEISETGKPTYNIEFRLTRDWSLVGEYDRFGDFNAGFKWRIYSK